MSKWCGWMRLMRALAWALLVVSPMLPTPLHAQSSPALEIASIHHDPAGTLAIFLRAGGGRRSEIRSLTMFVDDVPVVLELSRRADIADLALFLSLDSSGSMDGVSIRSAQEAAAALVQRLPAEDRVGVITFSTAPRVVSGLTSGRGSVLAAIQQIVADGPTSLYDAVAMSVQQLEQAPEKRRVVLLLSDGQDFGGVSKIGREASIERARQSGVVVYTVGLGPDYDESYLVALAEATAGQFFPMRNGSDAAALTALFERLGGELGASERYEVPMRPLTAGTHRLTLRAVVGGRAASTSTTFAVDNAGLMAPAVVPPSAPGDPIEVRINPRIAPWNLSFEARVGDDRVVVRLPSPSSDIFLVDPWAFAPGTQRVEIVAFASGGVALAQAVSIDVPKLAPLLSVSVAGGQLVAQGRIQHSTAPTLVAYEGDTEVGRSTTGTLAIPTVDKVTRVDLTDASGLVLATDEVTDEAVLGATSSQSRTMVLIVIVGLAAAAGGASWYRRRQIQRRKERFLHLPSPRRSPALERAAVETAHEQSTLGRLIVLDAAGNRRLIPLTRRPVTVGSSPRCDVTLADVEVRPVHLRITAVSFTEVQVHALGDRGSKPYESHDQDEWLIAQVGEQIDLGSYRLQIEMDPTADAVPALGGER
ncbi:MAG: VWA domain-containing protein [Dehalococcoidia bacterium]|nr:MAG: VWA domain-containing protein [Dehalococcoidia bacterium]